MGEVGREMCTEEMSHIDICKHVKKDIAICRLVKKVLMNFLEGRFLCILMQNFFAAFTRLLIKK